MKVIDQNTWSRSELFNHFKNFKDPRFSMTIPFNVTKCYDWCKTNKASFFVSYLHACMRAINETPNLNLRINDNQVIEFATIHASATVMRADKTFGFTYIKYSEDYKAFKDNFEQEKYRVMNNEALFPPVYSLGCIHCSANRWMVYTSHVEPIAPEDNGVPQLSFSKTYESDGALMMNVAINIHHGLVDGYHVGLFADSFQKYLNNYIK